MSKVALVIIYNHQYNANIALLETLYGERFSHIYHLVPFYEGDQANVIPVYESSYYFQGYVAQGFKSYFSNEYTHYLFIGDDLILNPSIHENNYKDCFGLKYNSCFVPELLDFHQRSNFWHRCVDAVKWKLSTPGLEILNQLPSHEEALRAFAKFGLDPKPLQFHHVSEREPTAEERKYRFRLPYPLMACYSDIFVVSADAIRKFAHLSGVFAASKLFVEVAIPTAMVLCADDISTEKSTSRQGRSLWTTEDHGILSKYDKSLKKLLSEFPEAYLYLHPVKLSKWAFDL